MLIRQITVRPLATVSIALTVAGSSTPIESYALVLEDVGYGQFALAEGGFSFTAGNTGAARVTLNDLVALDVFVSAAGEDSPTRTVAI